MQCFWYSMFCFCFQFPENAAGAVLLFVLVWEFRTNAYVQISCCIGLQLQCWVLPLPFPCSGMGDASRTWKERGYQYLQYWALVDAWENFSGGKILTATSDSLEIYMLCCSAFQVLLTVPSMLKRPKGKITLKRETVYTVNWMSMMLIGELLTPGPSGLIPM